MQPDISKPSAYPTKKDPLRLPGYGLRTNWIPSPSSDSRLFPNAVTSWAAKNVVLDEYAMTSVMNELSDKPNWDEKIFDTKIVAKWREEALAQPHFTEKMFDYCLAELRQQVRSFRETGQLFVLNNEAAVVKCDTAIPPSILADLVAAVKPLEDVPEDQRDWHPNSDNKVLDLVHPSLYPLMYGKSRILTQERIPNVLASLEYCGKGEILGKPSMSDVGLSEEDLAMSEEVSRTGRGWAVEDYTLGKYYSPDFQWLPCDVSFKQSTTDAGSDIEVEITSYINNLHPLVHRPLYDVIAKVIAKTIPLWDATLSYLKSENPPRIPMKKTSYLFPGGLKERPHVPDEDPDTTWTLDREWRETNRILVRPEPVEYAPRKRGSWKPISLATAFKDEGLQIIVKLANIVLTPGGKESYEGGSWHVEGQLNEHICASAIYYYAQENVTASRLAFRQYTSDDLIFQAFHQNDYSGVEELYGVENGSPTLQNVGSVLTHEGRLIAFPNVLQHQVQPFKLEDPTKPGYRKILALFLVDPHMRVISTANVPPQQREWWLDAIHDIAKDKSRLGELPVELMDKVTSDVEWPISFEEAKEVRLALMKQRGMYDATVNEDYEGGPGFMFCEH